MVVFSVAITYNKVTKKRILLPVRDTKYKVFTSAELAATTTMHLLESNEDK